VSLVVLARRSTLRIARGAARAGGLRKALVAILFLATLGFGGLARGEIIADLYAVSGVPGLSSDSAFHSIADISAAGGIVIGDILFSDFGVTYPPTTPYVSAPDAAAINITALQVNGDYGFRVDAGWSAWAQHSVGTTITFRARILPDAVADGRAFVGNSLYMTEYGGRDTTLGMVSISEGLFATQPAMPPPNRFVDEFVYYRSSTVENVYDSATFDPKTDLWVQKGIVVNGGIGDTGMMSLTQFVQLFHQSPGTSIPEPSSLVLLGMGAVGLVAFAWRKRR
jgi:hypothetical protein